MRRLLLALVICISCGGSPSYKDEAAKCQTPRSGVDPVSKQPYPDKQGTLNDEKSWLNGFMHDLYFWYREIPNADPSKYTTMDAYFQALKTPQKTASGRLKDQFSFTFSTADWEALSQSGVEAGYGVTWVTASRTPPGILYVGDTEPSSPAAAQNLTRGAQLVSIDGNPFLDASGNVNPGLSPQAIGESHNFTVQDRGSTTTRSFDMAAAAVTKVPVKYVGFLPSPNATVGYIFFSSHIATAESELIAAINQLQGATDLILDMRYNGGGYLSIASELAYMIAGPAKTANVTFEKTIFNDKYTTNDPVTGKPLTPTPFYAQSSTGQNLPHLDLPRVFILTAGGTCSASEAVINGLLGAGINVSLIGHNTCGKPYGFYAQDNCGTSYFAIEFQGVNAKGFGDYADGFIPGGTGPAGPPGCQVVDDFQYNLGDPNEGRLKAALQFLSSGTCPAPSSRPEFAAPAQDEAVVARNPLLENRWMPR